jgi:hypothetical protein
LKQAIILDIEELLALRILLAGRRVEGVRAKASIEPLE